MRERSERVIVATVAAIQFVNIVDFMMVMPLGPDFALALDIPTSNIGLVGGSYTVAAAVAGLVASRFLDRFGRRRALVISLIGLALGTLAAIFAVGLKSLVAARLLAGVFGGPATSLAISIVIDSVPLERRGRAMGAVMGSFAAASVLGVPLGLELATVAGWKAPFVAVGGMGFLAALAARYFLPPGSEHLDGMAGQRLRLREALRRPTVFTAWLMIALAMMAGFLIIPNISAFVQFNLGFPRDDIGMLYMAGGAVSFIAMRIAGRATDRWGPVPTATAATLLFMPTVLIGFAWAPPGLPVLPMFVCFMVATAVRNVTATTLVSQVPAPHERAGFMAVNSAVQHISASAGAFLSSLLLMEGVGGALIGMSGVVMLSVMLAATQPPLMYQLALRLNPRVVRDVQQPD